MADYERSVPRRAMLAGLGSAAVGLSGCVGGESERTTETETRRFSVETEVALELDNVNGPVTVDGHGGDELVVAVETTGTSDAVDATTVTTTRGEDRFRIATKHDESILDSLLGSEIATVSLTVQCPEDVVVERVETTSGSLAVRNVTGPVSMETTDGSIDATGLTALGDVSTTSGAVTVDIPAIVDDVLVETTSGGIDATLGRGLDAAVNAGTTNGSVRIDGDLDLAVAGTTASGSLGDGTHELDVESVNGDIILRAPTN